MEELVGKQFKRNVYGISSWTDTIKHVNILYRHTSLGTGQHFLIPIIYIIGENNNVPYTLDEILLIK